MARRRIALLYGGRSGEHEVSLRSATNVAAALARRHEVIPVWIDPQGRWWLQDDATKTTRGVEVFLAASHADRGRLRRLEDAAVVAEPEAYFPLVHGTNGEDGTLQGLLDLAGTPYVGSGVAASAAAMDKELMKALFVRADLPVADYRIMRGRDPLAEQELLDAFGLPLFVKPANMGSSVAISKVKSAAALAPALDQALAYDRKAVVERAVDAREIELSVLGNDAPEVSQPGEVVPDREFYDYESKYSSESRTELIIPAALDPAIASATRELARRAFLAVDAAGYARVDLFIERSSSRLFVNELNTIPGFTSISMFALLWEAEGLAVDELVARMVDLALERHATRARLRTDLSP